MHAKLPQRGGVFTSLRELRFPHKSPFLNKKGGSLGIPIDQKKGRFNKGLRKKGAKKGGEKIVPNSAILRSRRVLRSNAHPSTCGVQRFGSN